MQAAEIELKFPVADPEVLQGRLPHLGFHLATPRTYENNTLYDTPTRDLRARREVLRIRQLTLRDAAELLVNSAEAMPKPI